VDNILWTGIIRDTPEFKQWQSEIGEEGANIKIAQAGQKIYASNAILEILNPLDKIANQAIDDSNNTSIVSRLVYSGNSFLFTGDIEEKTEKLLILSAEDLDSDVLKVSHHGSKTSTSKEFLERVSPEISVISVGKDNTYGHPTQPVLDILAKYGIKILRTDLDNNIKITSDGKILTISNFQD
jgi:competence protein ComEC